MLLKERTLDEAPRPPKKAMDYSSSSEEVESSDEEEEEGDGEPSEGSRDTAGGRYGVSWGRRDEGKEGEGLGQGGVLAPTSSAVCQHGPCGKRLSQGGLLRRPEG